MKFVTISFFRLGVIIFPDFYISQEFFSDQSCQARITTLANTFTYRSTLHSPRQYCYAVD